MSKPFRVTFENRPQYLYAYVQADSYGYQIVKGYCMEIAEECKRTGCTKVLIDEDIPERVSIAEAFQIASEVPQTFLSGIRIAFVDRFIDQSDLNKFGELVALNRGVNGKLFSNAREAEAWLLLN